MYTQILQSYEAFRLEGVDDPLLETLQLFDLLTHGVLRKTAHSLFDEIDLNLTHLAKKRKEGVPLEYILERANFMNLELVCQPATLIPREETELLANVALDFVSQLQSPQNKLTIVDVGTGCGNLAVSLATYTNNTHILASDISSEAVAIAQENVNRLNLQERVTLFCGDMFAPISEAGYDGDIDMVVCNPPYIPTNSLDNLAPEIIDHEPIVALDAGTYGLDIYRKLITGALTILKPGGVLTFEIGEGQDKLVGWLLQRNGGYKNIELFRNEKGVVRVICTIKA